MQKTLLLYFFLVVLLTTMLSCEVSKQLPYFTDINSNSGLTTVDTKPYQPLRLQANDEIQVSISSTSPEASQFFNLFLSAPKLMTAGGMETQGSMYTYNVSDSGFITLPVLKNIRAAGLTTEELQQSIISHLKDFLKDPVVSVRLVNFKVTVIGEVGKPVVVPVAGQQINVLEAVGAAGDLTVYGMRRNVKVIRKVPNGVTEIAVLNFNNSDVLKSPYFQLKQNDIVYIQPNKHKGVTGSKASVWVPIVTSILYVGALILSREL